MTLLVNILLFLALLNISLFLVQPSMVFIPYGPVHQTPHQLNMKYEDVVLTTADDTTLHGWYIPHDRAQFTLLFFHGNAGNISHRLDSLKIFHQLELNIFIIDYRGYGKSGGSPDETKMYEDAQTAWHYLNKVKGLKKEDLIIFGRSMGGAVASHLAQKIQSRALILESTFSSYREMAHHTLPFLSHLVFLRFGFDTQAMIKKFHNPVLIMHSPDDEIVPYIQGEKIFRAANEPKYLIDLNGDHNSGFLQTQPTYEQQLKRFISRLK